MYRLSIALPVTAAAIAAASFTPAERIADSACDVVGTWTVESHRINGGEMWFAGDGLLVLNETHWARVETALSDVVASAGTYEVRGDSIHWRWEVPASLEYAEACQVDSEGLHLASWTRTQKHDTLRETDYRRVE